MEKNDFQSYQNTSLPEESIVSCGIFYPAITDFFTTSAISSIVDTKVPKKTVWRKLSVAPDHKGKL